MSVKPFYLILLLFSPLCRAENWNLPLFTSDPRTVLAAASSYPAPEGLNAITIDYSVEVQIDAAGKLTKTTRTVTRVLRLQGIAGARRIAASWIEWRQNRPKMKARVITADGKPHLLNEDDIGESAAGGMKQLSAVLTDADVDSVVEIEIQESDREAAMPGARLGEVVVENPFLIGHFRFAANASPGPALRVETRGFHNKPVVNSQSGRTVLESSNLYASGEGLLPPEVPPYPTITFSNVASWPSVARWYASMFDKSPTARASAPASAAADRMSAIEDAFEALRKQVPNNAIDFGVSPYAPRTTAKIIKSGDAGSQDEAVLLISKLAEIGIPARPALVSAGPHPDALRDLPGIEAFTRVLVYVPGEHPLWIDPIAEFTPVSRLPLSDQGRWALIVDPATTDLVRTPESTAADNREIQTMEIRLEDGGLAAVVNTLEGAGAFEELLRRFAKLVNSKDKDERENAENQAQRIAGVQRITKLEAPDPANLLTPCRIRAAGEGYGGSQLGDEGGFIDLPGPFSTDLQRLAIALRVGDPNAAAANSARKYDYYLPPTFTEERAYHVIPPPGYRFKQPPLMESMKVGPIQVSTTAKIDSDDSLWVTYRAVNPKERFTPAEVTAMRQDMAKLSANVRVRIVLFNVAAEKLANGDFKEAIGLLRQRVAAPNASVAAKLRLAAAYVEAGARAEGIKLCSEVISKDSSNAAAYARLGWIYTHDEFGRPFAIGMNMAEAEKAYLKALDLQDNNAYSIELATLDTFNAAGVRFGNSARLDDAVQLYRQIGFDVLAKTGRLNDYALTLLFARQYPELRQFFLYPQADFADPAIRLARIAASGSVNDLKEEAEYQFPDAAKRKIVLIEAARYLTASREFQPAVTLFNLVGGQGISQSDLALLRKAKAFDQGAVSQQPAIAAFQRFIYAVLNPPDPEAWKKFVVPEMRDASLAQLRWQLLELFGRQDAARQPVSWPSLADMLTTAIDFTAEPAGQGAFRILAPPGRSLAYATQRDKEILVSHVGELMREGVKSVSGDPAGMRVEARSQAKQGNFERAAAIERQICANPKATAADWNDLAWTGLFAHLDDKTMQEAADKAAELTKGRSPDVLHTLAVVEASTGRLKEARANGYILIDTGGGLTESLTIFGRIAEQLDLADVAKEYYRRVKKPEADDPLSAYAFAQMRLKELSGAKQ